MQGMYNGASLSLHLATFVTNSEKASSRSQKYFGFPYLNQKYNPVGLLYSGLHLHDTPEMQPSMIIRTLFLVWNAISIDLHTSRNPEMRPHLVISLAHPN